MMLFRILTILLFSTFASVALALEPDEVNRSPSCLVGNLATCIGGTDAGRTAWVLDAVDLSDCTVGGGMIQHECTRHTDGSFVASGSGGGSAGHEIQDETVPLAPQPALNFEGLGVDCVDSPGTTSTDCTIPGSAAGAAPAGGAIGNPVANTAPGTFDWDPAHTLSGTGIRTDGRLCAGGKGVGSPICLAWDTTVTPNCGFFDIDDDGIRDPGELCTTSARSMVFHARNGSGAAIASGVPVYFCGFTDPYVDFCFADANDTTKMGAIALTTVASIAGEDIDMASRGRLTVLTASVPGGGSEGDLVYVANGGGLTTIRPDLPSIAQPIGWVMENDATNMTIGFNFQMPFADHARWGPVDQVLLPQLTGVPLAIKPVSETDFLARTEGHDIKKGGTHITPNREALNFMDDPTGAKVPLGDAVFCEDNAGNNSTDCYFVGIGNVRGPATAPDNQIALFDGITGELIKTAPTLGLNEALLGNGAGNVLNREVALASDLPAKLNVVGGAVAVGSFVVAADTGGIDTIEAPALGAGAVLVGTADPLAPVASTMQECTSAEKMNWTAAGGWTCPTDLTTPAGETAHIIYNDATPLPQQPVLNLGDNVTCADGTGAGGVETRCDVDDMNQVPGGLDTELVVQTGGAPGAFATLTGSSTDVSGNVTLPAQVNAQSLDIGCDGTSANPCYVELKPQTDVPATSGAAGRLQLFTKSADVNARLYGVDNAGVETDFSAGATGDVVGPASALVNSIPLYAASDGKSLLSTGIVLDAGEALLGTGAGAHAPTDVHTAAELLTLNVEIGAPSLQTVTDSTLGAGPICAQFTAGVLEAGTEACPTSTTLGTTVQVNDAPVDAVANFKDFSGQIEVTTVPGSPEEIYWGFAAALNFTDQTTMQLPQSPTKAYAASGSIGVDPDANGLQPDQFLTQLSLGVTMVKGSYEQECRTVEALSVLDLNKPLFLNTLWGDVDPIGASCACVGTCGGGGAEISMSVIAADGTTRAPGTMATGNINCLPFTTTGPQAELYTAPTTMIQMEAILFDVEVAPGEDNDYLICFIYEPQRV